MDFTTQFTNYDLEFEYIRLPNIVISDEERTRAGITEKNVSNTEFLRKLISNGLSKFLEIGKIPKEKYEEYSVRAWREFDTLSELGFVDYVHLVLKVINFCEINNIARSPARGSCAGSLVFFLIGVTQIDSIKYELYFERFVSKARARKKIINGETYLLGQLAPDVDIDVNPLDRNRVIEYLNELYPNQVCQISNVSQLTGKILIKECGKAIREYPEEEMNRVSGMITKVFGNVNDLEKNYNEEKEFRDWCDNNKEVYETALKLRNLNLHFSTHASGLAITYGPLLDSLPLQLTKEKRIVSVYTMSDISDLCIKLDILGLRAATVVDDCCKRIGISWKDINVDDQIIYDNLKYGLRHPLGIFQLSTDCTLKVINKVKPKNLSQLSDVISLGRPGSLSFVDKYVDYVQNGNLQSLAPELDNILKETGNCILFQEQLLKIVHEVFGLSLEEAEGLRRGIGKKKHEVVEEYEKILKSQCEKLNIPLSTFEIFWKTVQASADFLFNRSHSYSYATLSAITLYLKYKHPLEFYISCLNQAKSEVNFLEEINFIQMELSDFGIKLLPPSLIASSLDFTVENNNIRYGLSSLKGISDKTIEKLLNFRKSYSNRFEIFEAAEQAKINIATLSCLIQSGCLESDAKDRSELVYEAQLYRLLTPTEKKYVHNIFQSNKSLDLRGILHYMIKHTNEKGKPYIKETRLNTLKRHSAPYKEIYEKNSKYSKLAIYYYEKQNMGFPYTYNLRQINPEFEKSLDTLRDIRDNKDKNEHIFSVCEVLESRKATSRKGTPYLKVTLQDETGTITAMAFNSERSATIDFIMEENGGILPKEGDIVFIKGKKQDSTTVFLDRMDIQTAKIYTKLAQLKNDMRDDKVDKQT